MVDNINQIKKILLNSFLINDYCTKRKQLEFYNSHTFRKKDIDSKFLVLERESLLDIRNYISFSKIISINSSS